MDTLSFLLNTTALIKTLGYAGLFGMVFAESGLFVGFFLPGDSLLFTAGFLASQGLLQIIPTALLIFFAAVLGDSVGYTFGRRMGPKIFRKTDSILFHREHIERAQHFYERHGGKTIVLARFIPVIRTFAPIVAGVGGMKYSAFVLYNLLGGLLWTALLTGLGYFLGSVIPGIDTYILPIVLLIIAVSIVPVLRELVRDKKRLQVMTFAFSKKMFPWRSKKQDSEE